MSTQILMTFLILTALQLAACHRSAQPQALAPLPEPTAVKSVAPDVPDTDNANAPVTSTDFDIKGSVQEAPR